MLIYKIIYSANILIAGFVGLVSLLSPSKAQYLVFADAFSESESVRITGALWTSICILSVCGLFFPDKFLVVFLLQFIYKSLWLLFGALPKILSKQYSKIPVGMSLFFLVYVLMLPFVIPFSKLFSN
jgi:hypothetical protein